MWLGFGLQFLHVLRYLVNLRVDFVSHCGCVVVCVVVVIMDVRAGLGLCRACPLVFFVLVEDGCSCYLY